MGEYVACSSQGRRGMHTYARHCIFISSERYRDPELLRGPRV